MEQQRTAEDNPWQRLASLTVYENPWIRVRQDDVIQPDGRPSIYGVVEFRNRAIGIVPVTDDGDTFLVGQWRYTLGRYTWEIPEGGGPSGESLLAAAQRELQEETGLTASRWTYLGELETSNSVTEEIGAVFLAEGLTQGEAAPEGTEVLQIRRLPLATAYHMAMTGEIGDAVAIVGLARAWHHLQTGRSLRPVSRSFPGYGG